MFIVTVMHQKNSEPGSDWVLIFCLRDGDIIWDISHI